MKQKVAGFAAMLQMEPERVERISWADLELINAEYRRQNGGKGGRGFKREMLPGESDAKAKGLELARQVIARGGS